MGWRARLPSGIALWVALMGPSPAAATSDAVIHAELDGEPIPQVEAGNYYRRPRSRAQACVTV